MSAGDYRELVNRDLPFVERGCTSKVPYTSRREAKVMASGRRGNGQLAPYHCAYCGSWHLGHRHR